MRRITPTFLFAACTAFFLAACAAPPPATAQTINLGDTLARWGYGRNTTKVDGTGRWAMKNSSMKEFSVQAEKNRSYVDLGGVRVWLGQPVVADKGSIFISKHDFDKSLSPILAPQAVSVPRVRTIVIDPGHGGKDTGTQNLRLGLNEKAMALDVALRLKSILEVRGHYKVYITRSRDNFVELEDRDAFANRMKADLFISIHFNSGSADVTGVETYCLTPTGQHSTQDHQVTGDTGAETGNRNDRWNILLGYYLQKSVTDGLDTDDRGVRRARFAVLRDLNCPGVLIECGFLSNTAEAKRIMTPVYREHIAQAIYDGILVYHSRVYKLAKSLAKK